MTDVKVTALGELRFGVEVTRGDRTLSAHTVTVPEALLDDLGLTPDDAPRLVERSFEFLLEREQPAQILGEFSVDEIERYFGDYRSEIRTRLGG